MKGLPLRRLPSQPLAVRTDGTTDTVQCSPAQLSGEALKRATAWIVRAVRKELASTIREDIDSALVALQLTGLQPLFTDLPLACSLRGSATLSQLQAIADLDVAPALKEAMTYSRAMTALMAYEDPDLGRTRFTLRAITSISPLSVECARKDELAQELLVIVTELLSTLLDTLMAPARECEQVLQDQDAASALASVRGWTFNREGRRW